MSAFFRSLVFLLREAFVNLRRHGLMTVAAVTTIAVTLALLGTFVLTFYQMHVATRRAAGEFEMQVYCLSTVKKTDLPRVQAKLKALPSVATVRYISKEQAYQESAKAYGLDMQGVPNTFNETFVVKMTEPKAGPTVAQTVRGWTDTIQEVALPEAEIGGVVRILNFLRLVGTVGGAVLLFGALVVVSNTIRVSVFSRRREIRIMQIVGAAPWFIRLPLLLEGLMHGVLGGIIAGLVLMAVDHSIHSLIQEIVPMLTRYFTQVDMGFFALLVVGMGALIGASGSLLSIRRYLRVI